MNKLILILFGLLLYSCGNDHVKLHLHYQANFNNEKNNSAEKIVFDVAKKWELVVFEKDKEQQKYLSSGEDVFFIALYFKNDPVIVVTNNGFSSILAIIATDFGKMPLDKLDKITKEIKDALAKQLDLDFELQVESKGSSS